MRIGCLQFAPEVGHVDSNLSRADAILDQADPKDLDLLVLPELAFSGYNFKSLHQIAPFLETRKDGITPLWAKAMALRHNCTVVAGYPEKVDPAANWPADPEYYNSALVVSADGEHVANYRKSHLYYTDETWALEGKGFYGGSIAGLGRTAIGICMDINPYKFQAPWERFEFAHHVLDSGARIVVVSMAWSTQQDAQAYTQDPESPDMDTLTYWMARLDPVIRSEPEEEIIVIFANRCGREGDATYAGTSAVIGIRGSEVKVYGILGRGNSDVLVVDTDDPPYAKLVFRPLENLPASSEAENSSHSSTPTSAPDSSGSSDRADHPKGSGHTSGTSQASEHQAAKSESGSAMHQNSRPPPLCLDGHVDEIEAALARSPMLVEFSPIDSQRGFFDDYQHPITPKVSFDISPDQTDDLGQKE